ncbi:MAG: glycerol-3-phosphate dehydrogenase subunit GlpB, partial [Actinomycetota bacterium]
PRVGFPAVLGLASAAEVVTDLSRRLGAEVFEIPTLPPSVPGLRLQSVLRQAIIGAGGRILDNMEVVSLSPAGDDRIAAVAAAAARRQRYGAKAAVLATGGILGGGVVGSPDGRLTEAVAGLEVAGPTSRSGWFDREVGETYPVFTAGVRAGGDLRPGAAHLPGVYVAGGLLAGADPLGEGSLEGISLATGIRAGRLAAGRGT